MTRKIIRLAVIIPSFVFAGYLVPGLWGAPVKAVSAFAPPMPIEGREIFHDYDEGLAYARQEGKPVIIDFTGYGEKNSRIQREQFGSNAQPYYVQLDAYGHQVAEPMAFTTDPNEFINWLQY